MKIQDNKQLTNLAASLGCSKERLAEMVLSLDDCTTWKESCGAYLYELFPNEDLREFAKQLGIPADKFQDFRSMRLVGEFDCPNCGAEMEWEDDVIFSVLETGITPPEYNGFDIYKCPICGATEKRRI